MIRKKLRLPPTDVDSSLLTPFVKTVEQPPPCIGWWKTRRASSPELVQPQRRWWDGASFSIPVLIGAEDETAQMSKNRRASEIILEDLEWCGLKEPDPSGYPYALQQTDRTAALEFSNANSA